jgi:hypothetical protein
MDPPTSPPPTLHPQQLHPRQLQAHPTSPPMKSRKNGDKSSNDIRHNEHTPTTNKNHHLPPRPTMTTTHRRQPHPILLPTLRPHQRHQHPHLQPEPATSPPPSTRQQDRRNPGNSDNFFTTTKPMTHHHRLIQNTHQLRISLVATNSPNYTTAFGYGPTTLTRSCYPRTWQNSGRSAGTYLTTMWTSVLSKKRISIPGSQKSEQKSRPSCSHLETDTHFKPGGVLIAALGQCAHRVTNTSRDPLGRWCSITLTGRDDKVLRLYSAYLSLAQQWHLLRLLGHDEPNPRQQLITDLKAELLIGQQQGLQFILLGDFNEVIGINPVLMASIRGELDLIDTIGNLHPHEHSTPTYNRGGTRIDYGLISLDFLPTITSAGMNKFHEVSTSDHRALFLDLDMTELFHL